MKFIKPALLLLLLIAFPAASFGSVTTISSIEFERWGNYDNITIRTDGWTVPTDQYTSSPLKLSLFFGGAQVKEPIVIENIDSPRIKKIEAKDLGQDPATVEVAFWLSEEIRYEVANIFGRNRTIVEITGTAPGTSSFADQQHVHPSIETKKEKAFPLPLLKSAGKFNVKIDGMDFSVGRVPEFKGSSLMVKAEDLFGLLELAMRFNKASNSYIAEGGGLKIEFKAGDTKARVGSELRELETAPEIKGNLRGRPIFIPLVSFAEVLGFGSSWDDKKKTLFLNPKIEKASVQDSPLSSIVIGSSRPLDRQRFSASLKDNTFVADIKTCLIEGEIIIENPSGDLIKKIRIYQLDPNTARVVAYLREESGFSIDLQDGGLKTAVTFAPSVERIVSIPAADHYKLEIYADSPMSFETYSLSGPDRIVIDIPDKLYKAAGTVKVLSGIVSSVRAAQHRADPPLSRIVIDLERRTDFKTFVSEDKKKISIIVPQPSQAKKAAAPAASFPYVRGKKVAIEPGHGGKDPGTIGFSGKLEKHACMATAIKIARLLSKHGAQVILTREKDEKIPRARVVEIVNNSRADVFISVHYNSYGSPAVSGIETYYFTPQSRYLAEVMHRNLIRELNRKNRGVKKVTFYTIHHTNMPSVLIEPGYITNKHEETLAFSPWYQERAAMAVLKGLNEYFKAMR